MITSIAAVVLAQEHDGRHVVHSYFGSTFTKEYVRQWSGRADQKFAVHPDVIVDGLLGAALLAAYELNELMARKASACLEDATRAQWHGAQREALELACAGRFETVWGPLGHRVERSWALSVLQSSQDKSMALMAEALPVHHLIWGRGAKSNPLASAPYWSRDDDGEPVLRSLAKLQPEQQGLVGRALLAVAMEGENAKAIAIADWLRRLPVAPPARLRGGQELTPDELARCEFRIAGSKEAWAQLHGALEQLDGVHDRLWRKQLVSPPARNSGRSFVRSHIQPWLQKVRVVTKRIVAGDFDDGPPDWRSKADVAAAIMPPYALTGLAGGKHPADLRVRPVAEGGYTGFRWSIVASKKPAARKQR